MYPTNKANGPYQITFTDENKVKVDAFEADITGVSYVTEGVAVFVPWHRVYAVGRKTETQEETQSVGDSSEVSTEKPKTETVKKQAAPHKPAQTTGSR